MDWIQHPERRHSQDPFPGPDRRAAYSHGELPPDPTPGDPGPDARNQQGLEKRREVERERSEAGFRPGEFAE